MNNFKKVVLIAGFALLAACGNNSEKFVGVWIDPSPVVEDKGTGMFKSVVKKVRADTVIKENGDNKVMVTGPLFGSAGEKIYEVDGANIMGSGGRVLYALDGDELVTISGLRLVRKK